MILPTCSSEASMARKGFAVRRGEGTGGFQHQAVFSHFELSDAEGGSDYQIPYAAEHGSPLDNGVDIAF